MNLDRFSQGLSDLQAEPHVARCAGCGGEIYEDERVWITPKGRHIHDNTECFGDYLMAQYTIAEKWRIA
jgi:hypothetical protein